MAVAHPAPQPQRLAKFTGATPTQPELVMSLFWDVSALDSRLGHPEQFDPEGFLRQPSEWTPEMAQAIAACIPSIGIQSNTVEPNKSVSLSADHLTVLNAARDFYQRFQRMPTTRVFVKFLSQEAPHLGNSIALMQLFPDTPMRWVAICAGLPKPPNCF
jgi:tRNA 2-thiouridine synthesizing protein E